MIRIAILPIMQGRDYPAAGDALYQIIVNNIDDADKFVLDMRNVPMLPSMFLNTSIGRLIDEKGVSFVKEKFAFTNIKASDATRIRDYVNRFVHN